MVTKAAPGTFDGIRFFKVDEAGADQPTDTLMGQWKLATPQNIPGFSATLFYFGEALHERGARRAAGVGDLLRGRDQHFLVDSQRGVQG